MGNYLWQRTDIGETHSVGGRKLEVLVWRWALYFPERIEHTNSGLRNLR